MDRTADLSCWYFYRTSNPLPHDGIGTDPGRNVSLVKSYHLSLQRDRCAPGDRHNRLLNHRFGRQYGTDKIPNVPINSCQMMDVMARVQCQSFPGMLQGFRRGGR